MLRRRKSPHIASTSPIVHDRNITSAIAEASKLTLYPQCCHRHAYFTGTVNKAVFASYSYVRVHALKGLACRARVTSASLHASPCSCEALTSPACHACGCPSSFRTRFCDINQNWKYTAGCLSFRPMAQCVVHALKGLACCARVTPASLSASHCKQCSALTSPSLHARGCASPSRAR